MHTDSYTRRRTWSVVSHGLEIPLESKKLKSQQSLVYVYVYITTILANWCYINNVGLLICCTCWHWMINIFSSWVINYPRLGFTDSWMRFSCRYRGKRMRIDYFIVSEQLKDRITACEMHGQGIELEGASYFILIIPIK